MNEVESLQKDCMVLKDSIKIHAHVTNYIERSNCKSVISKKNSCTASFCIADLESLRHLKSNWIFCSKCSSGLHAVCALLLSKYSIEKVDSENFECFSCSGVLTEANMIEVSTYLS